jgi:hypothetical protein
MTEKNDPGTLAGTTGNDIQPGGVERKSSAGWAFEWPTSDETRRARIGHVSLLGWLRYHAPVDGVLGVADVEFPRRGVQRCRLRWVRGRLRVETVGAGFTIQWREVNPKFAWIVAELVVAVDPEVRTPEGEVPYIASPSNSWGAP